MTPIDGIFFIAILIMSVVIHEISHGFVAERLGDKTARLMGRLTLNPLKHLDWFGSVLLPAFLVFTHASFLVGWAKPVPYNPNNLSNRKWGTVAVASAGVLANLLIALLFSILIRLAPVLGLPVSFYKITIEIVLINLGLAIFNLVPIPPLDGSKILFNLLPESMYPIIQLLEQYSLIFLILFIFFFSSFLVPILTVLYHIFTGLTI